MTCDVTGLVVLPEFNRLDGRENFKDRQQRTVKDKDRDSERWKLESYRASEDKREATIELLLDVKISFTV